MWSFRKRSQASNLAIHESESGREVSLTGYSNVALDVSSDSAIKDYENRNIRLKVGKMPSKDLQISGYEKSMPAKREYSVDIKAQKSSFRTSSKDGKLPINRIGFLSYIFVTWLSPLVWKMFRYKSEPISESDIWKWSDEDGVDVNTKQLIHLWKEELERKGKEKASFMRVWLRFIRTRNLVSMLILTLAALATFTSSGFLLNQVISYLESEENNLSVGIGLAAAALCCEVVRAISLATLGIFSCQTGARFQCGFMGIIYDKLLKMRTVKGKTKSEIINAVSVDSTRIYHVTVQITVLLIIPMYGVISTVYCYILIGYWCFVAIGTYGLCSLGQATLSRLITSLRSKCVQYTDIRVKRMREVLNNMKFIKMYAWEKPFNDAITDARNTEKKYLMHLSILNAVIGSIIPVTPTMASILTITVYSAAGNVLTASTTFAFIGTMNFLRVIMTYAPRSLRAFGEAKVSFTRIKHLLLMDEHVEPSTECSDKDNAIEIKAADFVWEDSTEQKIEFQTESKMNRMTITAGVPSVNRENAISFELKDINFDLQKGTLIGICGSVGSGKSSLMSAVLGRMIMKRGHLAVNGNVAYVAQQAWIFNASLKDNVLFGKDFDANRYSQAVSCCGLDPDIRTLPYGDDTEIGERGINLSGGQKQRVSLARSVYSNRDIFVLDDPLSALDVKVGEQVFRSCVKEVLKQKTVLLVTHQLQYLEHCDEIFVMADGTIKEKGQHKELLALNGLYTNMLKIFERTTAKPLNSDHRAESELNVRQNVKNIELMRNGPSSGGETKQSEEKANKDKLVVSEEAAVGHIGFGTYNVYIQAAGGWLVAILVILVYFTASGSIVFSDWWLSQWITSLNMEQPSTSVFENSSAREAIVTNDLSTNGTTLSRFTNTKTRSYLSESLTNVNDDTYFTVYIVSLVGIIALQVFQGLCLTKVSFRASSRLHAKCLDKVMKAQMFFFDSNPVGRVLNRFSKDLDEGDVFLPQSIETTLRMFTLTFLSVAMAAFTSPWILLSVFPVILVFVLMKRIASVAIRQLKRLENVSRSPLISHVNMTSDGLSTVVAYQEKRRCFEKLLRHGDNASMAVFLFDASMQWIALRIDLAAGLITVSTTLILVLTKGMIAPASAGMVLALYGKTVGMIQILVRRVCDVEARFTSVERLNEYAITLIPEAQEADTVIDPNWPDKGSVTFSDVIMRYRQYTNPVLRSVNFDIRAKEKCGIVGRTGAGKSSLAAVLFRLIELCGGTIYVDGVDISKVSLTTLRSRISTITQEPVLFAGTIKYNVDPFSKYSDIDIWEALDKVHMKKKILQSDAGLEGMIEENGENFSVGERQLICLARAVLRKSKILLLDEATANIDTSTDALIQETIRECFADCTVITIAHRLSTVKDSDKIIVLDSGQIMECGPPRELINNPRSFFNSMVNAQSGDISSPL